MRFWLDRGAAGFRIDVAHALAKAPGTRTRARRATTGKRGRTRCHTSISTRSTRSCAAGGGARRVRRQDDGRRGLGRRRATPAVPSPRRISPGLRLRSAVGPVGRRGSSSGSSRRVFDRPTRWGRIRPGCCRTTMSSATPRDTDCPPMSIPRRWLLDGPHELLDDERGAQSGARRCTRHARPARVRRTSTRATNSACPRRGTCHSTYCRIRSGTTRATRSRDATAVGCRFLGSRPDRRSGSEPTGRGCRNRHRSLRSPPRCRTATPRRRSSCTGRRSDLRLPTSRRTTRVRAGRPRQRRAVIPAR